jgi:hypothetical protein
MTTPLLVLYSCATAWLKFKEGYLVLGDGGAFPSGRIGTSVLTAETRTVYPKPMTLWTAAHKTWILPLNFVISIVWIFEWFVAVHTHTFVTGNLLN